MYIKAHLRALDRLHSHTGRYIQMDMTISGNIGQDKEVVERRGEDEMVLVLGIGILLGVVVAEGNIIHIQAP